MTHDGPTKIAGTPSSEAPPRKRWQAPHIEDVSISMTAKNTSTSEISTTKDGS